MDCPFCLHKKTEIYNSRSTRGGLAVWRRRRCLACGKTFTTQEHFDPSGIWKVKNSKKATGAYTRALLVMSILRACDHRTNQNAATWYLYEIIEAQLAPLVTKNGTITTKQIVDVTSTVLQRYDATAAIKYLSYHAPTLDMRTLRQRLRRR